jgi:hypothetical protein
MADNKDELVTSYAALALYDGEVVFAALLARAALRSTSLQ